MILPTLNAGPMFPRVLASIRRQSGVRAVELVVADCGSVDGTREHAANAGALIIDVPPNDFGHGRTRNLAAEAAGGDVLLMLVQDAVLLGTETVRNLVLELREAENIAAVTARQVPRSDADLYAAFVVYAHTFSLQRVSEAARRRRFESLSPAQRRAAAGVDNVCSAIRRAAWRDLRFADTAFAEDLDFGVRAVKRGWTVTRARQAAVAHSHTREAAYHFRRSVVDRLFVASLVGDDARTWGTKHGRTTVLGAALPLIGEVQGSFQQLPAEAPLSEHVAASRSALCRGADHLSPRDDLASLAELFTQELVTERYVPSGHASALLRDELVTLLGSPLVEAFTRAHRSVGRSEAVSFLTKLTAAFVGRALGDSLRHEPEPHYVAQLLRGI